MDQVSQSLTANLVDFHLGPEHANPRFVNDSCELLEATWGLYRPPKKTLLGDPWVIQYTFLWTQTHSSSNFVYPNISKYNCFWMSTPSHKWHILRHWKPVLSTCADLNQGQSPLSPRYLMNKRIDRLPYLTYNMCNGEGHDFPHIPIWTNMFCSKCILDKYQPQNHPHTICWGRIRGLSTIHQLSHCWGHSTLRGQWCRPAGLWRCALQIWKKN